MKYIDYTHPDRVPSLHLADDRRTPKYYLRLDELAPGHPYYAMDWALFRYPDWLEGGSAWVQAKAIYEDLELIARQLNTDILQLRPVVGSADPGFDEALAQALMTFDLRPVVAEVVPRELVMPQNSSSIGV